MIDGAKFFFLFFFSNSEVFDLPKLVVNEIIHELLGYRKKSSRWIGQLQLLDSIFFHAVVLMATKYSYNTFQTSLVYIYIYIYIYICVCVCVCVC